MVAWKSLDVRLLTMHHGRDTGGGVVQPYIRWLGSDKSCRTVCVRTRDRVSSGRAASSDNIADCVSETHTCNTLNFTY